MKAAALAPLAPPESGDHPLTGIRMSVQDGGRIASRAWETYLRESSYAAALASGEIVELRGIYLSRNTYRVLEAIRASWAETGRGPTKVWIAKRVDLETLTVQSHLATLREFEIIDGMRATLREIAPGEQVRNAERRGETVGEDGHVDDPREGRRSEGAPASAEKACQGDSSASPGRPVPKTEQSPMHDSTTKTLLERTGPMAVRDIAAALKIDAHQARLTCMRLQSAGEAHVVGKARAARWAAGPARGVRKKLPDSATIASIAEKVAKRTKRTETFDVPVTRKAKLPDDAPQFIRDAAAEATRLEARAAHIRRFVADFLMTASVKGAA